MRPRLSRLDFVAGATLVPALGAAARAAEAYTMRMGLAEPMTSIFGLTAVRFAQSVDRRTNGQITIEIYPSFTLAKPQETIDGLVSGVVDLALQASAYLVPLVPRLQVFDLPFMFRSIEAGYRVLDGPIGREFTADLDAKGISAFAFGASGFKELSIRDRAVNVPDDMKGLRVRIQSGAVYVAMYQALGAIPIVIDANEAFLALQNRTVDAVDFNLNLIASDRYGQLVKHVALLHQVFSVIALMGSKKKVEALPANLQRALREEAKAVLPYWRRLVAEQTAAAVEALEKGGVAFNEVPHALFRKAVDPVYASFAPRLGGDLVDRVSRAANGGG